MPYRAESEPSSDHLLALRLGEATSPPSIGIRTEVVEIKALLPADSPRLAGEDIEHAHRLAETDARLPPILVHRRTMRVIDGMHRLRAALLRGKTTIQVQFYDGAEDDAFVRAVEANIAHGLPLSSADREAAAVRIIASHPEWSNRAIAAAVGLSDKTVSSIRRRSTAENPQLNTRVGKDGRIRPLSSSEGRQRASEVIAARPDASIREIARAAGIAVGTARDVRERMKRGEDPVPARHRATAGDEVSPSPGRVGQRRLKAVGRVAEDRNRSLMLQKLQSLKNDPSLKLKHRGRSMLRLLDTYAIETEDWAELVEILPEHCVSVIADLARGCAEVWRQFADELEQKERPTA